MKKKSISKLIGSLSLLVIVCLPSLMWTFNHIDRYTNWVVFFFALIVLGATLGFSIFKITTKNNIELKKYRTKKGVSLLHVIITLSIILIPFLGLIINENLGVTSVIKNFKIDKVEHSSANKYGRKAHYIFILNGDKKIERLEFGKEFVSKYSKRDSVLLCINRGIFGFSYYSIPKKD